MLLSNAPDGGSLHVCDAHAMHTRRTRTCKCACTHMQCACAVVAHVLLTKMKIAFSAGSEIRLRST